MSLNRILCRLSEVGDNSTQNNPGHTLESANPVRDLLPDAYTTPWLEPPPDAPTRHPPSQQRTTLGLARPTFSVVLTPASMQRLESDASNAIALTGAISDRAHVSGTSKLQFVAYFDEALTQVVYRFRRINSTFSMPAHFQLGSNDICMLFTRGVATEWVGMLLHIVTRASDRAHYRVHDNLQQYFGDDVASEEEAGLS